MEAVRYSFLFLVLNVIALQVIVWLKGRQATPRPEKALPSPTAEGRLEAENILEWEYEYIRHTASEAMQDRHTMINFYLVLVGVVASGVLANLGKLQNGAATLLLWSVCSVGWFHFLILVRLREAWHESLLALLQLRDFYVRYSGTEKFPSDELMKAFRWRRETLPTADKPWSVFHYSALLIALLDSMAFGVGGYLLGVGRNTVSPFVGLSIALFAYHIWVYSALLKTAVKTAELKTAELEISSQDQEKI